MAVNGTAAADQEYRLPCGRQIEQVWERLDAVEAGMGDAHENSCPHCAAARESLLALRAATNELIDEPEPPPPDLVGRIMSAVRAESRRGRRVPLPTDQPGGIDVSEQAVAVVVRYAADTVPGVRARRCRVQPVGTEPDGSQLVDVELSLAVRFGYTVLDEVLPVVRERVRAALGGRVGLLLGRLDLLIADTYTEDGQE